jgi:hypothetical protein
LPGASATFAPAFASSRAQARPIPRLAPVTIAMRLSYELAIIVDRGHSDNRHTTWHTTTSAISFAPSKSNKELKRIPFEVDTRLEITEFADRSVKTGGPALLFEKPKGSPWHYFPSPCSSTPSPACAAWRSRSKSGSVDEVAKRISEYLEMRMPEGLLGKLKMLPKLAEMGAFFPKIVSKGLARK